MRSLLMLAVIAVAAVAASNAAAAGEPQTVTLDGQVVTLPNQGDTPKITLRENLSIDCQPGSIRVGPKIELGTGKKLNLVAPSGEAILGVSIKSGAAYTMTVTFSANGAYVVVSQDISNYVVVYCRPTDGSNPVCVLTGSGVNSSGAKFIQVTVQDPQTGLQAIVVDEVDNASVVIAPAAYVGSVNPVVITATKIDPSQSSFLKLTVTNIAGGSTTCDPPVPAVAPAKRWHRHLAALYRTEI